MKGILAICALTLAVGGASFTDSLRDAVTRFVIGKPSPTAPPPSTGPIVTATPAGFGSSLHAGDHIQYVIDVQTPGAGYAGNLFVIQTPSNLTLGPPQVTCLAPRCALLQPNPPVAGQPVGLIRLPGGGHESIVMDATIVADGHFSVAIATATNASQLQDPTLVATLPGDTAVIPASNTATNGAANTTSNTETKISAEPVPNVTAFPSLTPRGPYDVGSHVTATITFTNNGAAQVVINTGKDRPRNLTDVRYGGQCPLPCYVTLAPGQSVVSVIEATVAPGPDGAAPSSFQDSVVYNVDEARQQPVTFGGPVSPDGSKSSLPLLLGLAAAAIATLITATVAIHSMRRAHWQKLINVQPGQPGAPDFTPGAIPRLVSVRVEDGPAGPTGPIPIRRIA